MITPTSWLLTISGAGSLASASMSAASIELPASRPPRSESTFVSRAVSASAFATATGSPSVSMNAIAVGPSSSASSDSVPAASAARRVSVFFTTCRRAPLPRSFARSSWSWAFVRPR